MSRHPGKLDKKLLQRTRHQPVHPLTMSKFFFLIVIVAIFASAVFALEPQPSSEEVEDSEDMGAFFQTLFGENSELNDLFEKMQKEPENEEYLNEFLGIMSKAKFGFNEKSEEEAPKVTTVNDGTKNLDGDL